MSREQVEGKHLERFSYQQLIEVVAAIERTLECSVCLKCIRDTAVTCSNGHGVCTACAKGLRACPSCRTLLSTVKPTMLNSVISLLPRLCRYSSNGCETTIIPSSKEHHERYCGYRNIVCHGINCEWRGLSNDLLKHLKCDHAKDLLTANNPVVKWPVIENNRYYCLPVYAFGYIMWLEAQLNTNSLKIYISISGEVVLHRILAVISLKRADVEFTDTISVCHSSDSSEPKGIWKDNIEIPRKVFEYFLFDGFLIHSLKIIEEFI